MRGQKVRQLFLERCLLGPQTKSAVYVLQEFAEVVIAAGWPQFHVQDDIFCVFQSTEKWCRTGISDRLQQQSLVAASITFLIRRIARTSQGFLERGWVAE